MLDYFQHATNLTSTNTRQMSKHTGFYGYIRALMTAIDTGTVVALDSRASHHRFPALSVGRVSGASSTRNWTELQVTRSPEENIVRSSAVLALSCPRLRWHPVPWGELWPDGRHCRRRRRPREHPVPERAAPRRGAERDPQGRRTALQPTLVGVVHCTGQSRPMRCAVAPTHTPLGRSPEVLYQ